MTQKTYPDSTTVEYTYDLVGKITQVNDPTGTYGFSYDNMGRLTGTSTQYGFLAGTFTNSYTYDAASNRTGFTTPDSSTNTYSYDTLNRLTTLANSWAGSFGFTYDALSRRTQMTRPNTVTTNYSYDNLSHLLSVLRQLSGSTIDGASYTLDSVGNRTAKTDDYTNATSNYSYDSIYELNQVTQGDSTTESYSYDAAGNRTASLGVSSYTNNSSNELTATSSASYAQHNRRACVAQFVRWANERGIEDPMEVTRPMLESYQRHLYYYRQKNGKPLTFRTQYARLVPVRASFRWLVKNNHILHNPASDLDMPKLEKRLPRVVLNEEEAERVMIQPDLHDPLEVRDRAILETFYSTGIRRMELVHLKLYNVDHLRGAA